MSDEFKAFPYVEVDGEVWECISNSGRCGQAGYEPGVNYPGFGALYLEAWKPLMESCSGPNPNPNLGDALMGESPAWEKLGCPEEYDSEVTYEEGDNVVASGNIVYECKGFPDTQFCNLISPEGSNGWPGSLGWTTVGSCDGTSELCDLSHTKVLLIDAVLTQIIVVSNLSQQLLLRHHLFLLTVVTSLHTTRMHQVTALRTKSTRMVLFIVAKECSKFGALILRMLLVLSMGQLHGTLLETVIRRCSN